MHGTGEWDLSLVTSIIRSKIFGKSNLQLADYLEWLHGLTVKFAYNSTKSSLHHLICHRFQNGILTMVWKNCCIVGKPNI